MDAGGGFAPCRISCDTAATVTGARDPPLGAPGRSVGCEALMTGDAQGVRLACQFVSLIVLSRLLAPENFGIVAMAPCHGLCLTVLRT